MIDIYIYIYIHRLAWEKCSTHWCSCFMMIQWSVAVASTCLSALPQLSAQQIKTWILRSSWVMSDESSVMRQRNKETKQRRTEEASTSATKPQTGKQPTKQTRNQTNNRTSNQAKTQAGEQSNQQTKKTKHALLSKKPSMLGEWLIRKQNR